MTDKTADIVIAGAARTPMGAFQGELAPLAAPELGGAAIAGAIRNAGLDKAAVDEVIMGCVLPAGVGQAPARQAGFAAGLGEGVPASTLNKVCGSGMKTVMMAHDLVRAGSAGMVVAGGMESMTNAPYLSPAMRGGARLGPLFHRGLPRRASRSTRRAARPGPTVILSIPIIRVIILPVCAFQGSFRDLQRRPWRLTDLAHPARAVCVRVAFSARPSSASCACVLRMRCSGVLRM